jgi:hypothetical protein
MYINSYSCYILIKLKFSPQDLKIPKSNFIKNSSVEAELFHSDGRTNRHDEAHSRFLQLCKSA